MPKRDSLKVGQHIWIEIRTVFFRGSGDKREINEHIIVEANNSSAYAISTDDLDKYNADIKNHSYLRRRITQRTHEVKGLGFGDSYVLWLSKESFEANVKYNKDLKTARKKAHEIVDSMTLAGLENFIFKNGD